MREKENLHYAEYNQPRYFRAVAGAAQEKVMDQSHKGQECKKVKSLQLKVFLINLLWISAITYFAFRREEREREINLIPDPGHPPQDHLTNISQGSRKPLNLTRMHNLRL